MFVVRHSEDCVPDYERVRFEVEDSGVGIAPEKLKEIFLPFQQIGEQRYSIEGTGLGLAISRRIVEMMGGELRVNSTVGKGSVFWFDVNLPVVEGGVAHVVKSSRKVIGYKGERHTLLVVDDNKGNRDVLVNMLFPLGFNIAEAENGEECVEKTLKLQPDLILLDLRMPVLDGFGAAAHIRKAEGRRQKIEEQPEYVPTNNHQSTLRQAQDTAIINHQSSIHPVIIAVSANVFETTQKRALASGFNDFLVKPFQLEHLLELLQRYLQLEWVYKERLDEKSSVVPQMSGGLSTRELLPSEEDLEILVSLASKGRIKPLLQHLSKLDSVNQNYHPFIEEMRQLAKRFQAKEIVKRIQQL